MQSDTTTLSGLPTGTPVYVPRGHHVLPGNTNALREPTLTVRGGTVAVQGNTLYNPMTLRHHDEQKISTLPIP